MNTNRRRLGLGVLACALIAAALATTACSASSQKAPQTAAPTGSQSTATSTTAESTTTESTATESTAPAPAPAAPAEKVQIKDNVVGKGAVAKSGDQVTVNYTGWLMDGTKFDSSLDRNQPFSFVIGAGQVIQGWDEGVAGMKVGGTRTLIIPPSLGYGDQGAPPAIPPNATLKFQIELLAVQPGQ